MIEYIKKLSRPIHWILIIIMIILDSVFNEFKNAISIFQIVLLLEILEEVSFQNEYVEDEEEN